MTRSIKKVLISSYMLIKKLLLKMFYPQKPELLNKPIIMYIIPQKILNINGCKNIPWPVHFTSHVFGKITVGKFTSPGITPCCYIQGINGIEFGDNVWIGPGAKIISANHDENNLQFHKLGKPIKIGNNVWIGANAVILPEVIIGDNSVIGAGSVVTKNVKNNSVVAGNPANLIRVIPIQKGLSNNETYPSASDCKEIIP